MGQPDNSPPHRPLSHLQQSYSNLPIRGMESVVATVSGYHGSERFNLIKLISHSGASYVGAMSRSITHLVCRTHEGRKYDLAKKFKTKIVNHQWIEDCISQGKRVSDRAYMLKSGQEVGPVLLEAPGSRASGAWSDSDLLNQNLFPNTGKGSNTSNISKRKLLKRTFRQDHVINSNSCFQEPPLPESDRMKHESKNRYSMNLSREERMHGNGKITGESSREGRKLAKMKVIEDISHSLRLDSDQECRLNVYNKYDNVSTSSSQSDNEMNVHMLETKGDSDDQLRNQRVLQNGLEHVEEIEDIEVIEQFDKQYASRHSNINIEDKPFPLTRNSQDGFSSSDILKEAEGEPQLEQVISATISAQVSCVICWTDFSLTRGVLPCGHRFCYSCIQNWADHMASRGKISTCPLCKARCMTITKVEDAATSDQKIYSQTIPYSPSTVDIIMLSDQERSYAAQSSRAPVCSACQSREPEDLLITCHLCLIRHIHSYCLDPLLLPWTCIHCKDLQMLFHHNR